MTDEQANRDQQLGYEAPRMSVIGTLTASTAGSGKTYSSPDGIAGADPIGS
jgi:hypothetical protein